MFAVRYDMRRPDWATADTHALYAAALDQAAFVDERGLGTIVVSEHRLPPTGTCRPHWCSSAVAARTTSTHISLAMIIATLHDPVRLAEDVAVLDLVSGVHLAVLGLGCRPGVASTWASLEGAGGGSTT